MIYDGWYQNADAVILENEQIRTVLLPRFGGKIVSLYHKANRFELLFQNPKPQFTPAFIGASFAAYEACGFDDVFPSVEAEVVSVGREKIMYPDHGELWSHEMKTDITANCLTLSMQSTLLPYRFMKTVMLFGGTLQIRYQFTHTGDVEFPYVFFPHCLVAERKGMQLSIPAGQKKYLIQTANMEKWYLIHPLKTGNCGYIFPNEKISAFFQFSYHQLPYLGFWRTAGGFRGDHNCALEPASAYYDSVTIAAQNNRESILMPKETLDIPFSITMKATD